MFLILFDIIYTFRFLLNRTIFLAVRQAFARIHLGFFQVWGKCCSIIFQHQMVYWCLYTLRFNLGIYEFYFILWQMLSHLMLFLIIVLTDVIVKVTVTDFMATFFWQMLLPLILWDGVISHNFNFVLWCYLSDRCYCQWFCCGRCWNHFLDPLEEVCGWYFHHHPKTTHPLEEICGWYKQRNLLATPQLYRW